MQNLSSNQKIPFVVSVISTKCSVTKSTNIANIDVFCSEHGIKALMIDTERMA